jgi:APA family basic amino acid/polyamine antiporter
MSDVVEAVPAEGHLEKSLGLFSATTIVVGSMIGSGIFIVSADIARGTDSPALLIGCWALTAIITIFAALSYGELAAMMPQAGGQYVYLHEAMGPVVGFLYGWTLFLVIQTGLIAAVGVAFAKFLGVFFPAISGTHWILHFGHVPALHVGTVVMGNMDIGLNTNNLIAIVVIAFITLINCFGVRLGALIQNIFTVAKSIALIGLILVGLALGRNAAAIAANFGGGWHNFWRHATGVYPLQIGVGGPMVMVHLLTILAVMQVGSLFSSDAWNNVTFTAGEIRNPSRNLPLSLVLGTGFVLCLYIITNFVYLMVLPLHGDPNGTTIAARGIQYASEDRVGTAVLESIFHSGGAYLMAGAILMSTFGCINGMVLAGARVFYAMSRDGLFFAPVGHLHPKYNTPVISLVLQGLWAIVLCISGSYGQLLDYVIFASLVFYILTISCLFVLRSKRPDMPRPYRAIGYPVLPALYIVAAAFICGSLLIYKPQYTWPGLILVLLGLPVYAIWSKSKRAIAM